MEKNIIDIGINQNLQRKIKLQTDIINERSISENLKKNLVHGAKYYRYWH